ncbi:MAG: hypothetical protein ACSHX6_01045 [Akkermansiaceae bacterium]
MIKQTLLISLITTTSSLHSLAQKPSSQSSSVKASNNTTINRPPQEKQTPYGSEIPIVDPTNKTIQFQGKTHSLSDNHIGGQFEAYLSTDTLSSAAAAKYRATISEILDYLAPNKTGGAKLKPAYDLLSQAAKYSGDGNLCESLANAIYAAQLTKQHRGTKRELAANLKEERRKILHNLNVITTKLSFNEGNKKESAKQQQTIEVTTMEKRLAEIELALKQLDLSGALGMAQSKLQYQSMIVQLFAQRRYEHVIMATRFYNLIYRDGDNKLTLKKGSDAADFFTNGVGVEPTVAGLDAASAEAIRKVDTLVNAFHNNLKTKRVHAASERLVEAFVIGEFLPSVQTINIVSKAPIQQYIQDANDLVKVLGAKDLSRAEELNNSLQQQATDYNASEAKSYISAKKTESKLNTRDAKIALRFMLSSKNSTERNNEQTRFKSAMAKATLAWPSNPELEAINNLVDDKFAMLTAGDDMLLVARKDFDRYVDTKSYSAVMKEENLSRFIASFHLSKDPQDIARAKLLKQIQQDITAVFATLTEAKTYYNRGLAPAAWELVDIAIKKHPNNLELAKAKALYSSKAATFANTIAKAQDYESISPKSAQALTWFLKAEHIHPESQYAKEGINRIITAKFKTKNNTASTTTTNKDLATNY